MPASKPHDPVQSPVHYTSLGIVCEGCLQPIECITVTEHFDFIRGNLIKYAWRAGLKDGTDKLLDLEKCLWYATRAVEREKNARKKSN